MALLDVRMPEISGLDVAAQLRQEPINTPIIFLTAAGDTTDLRRQGYALGGVDFLIKPFDAQVLRSKVRVFVELHEQRRELERLSRSFAADRSLAQQRVQLLASLAARLSRLLTTDEVVELVLAEASAQLQASVAQLYLTSPDGEQLIPAGHRRSSFPPALPEVPNGAMAPVPAAVLPGATQSGADSQPLPSLRFAAHVSEPLWLQNADEVSATIRRSPAPCRPRPTCRCGSATARSARCCSAFPPPRAGTSPSKSSCSPSPRRSAGPWSARAWWTASAPLLKSWGRRRRPPA